LFETRVTKLLGIKYPIIQGAMGGGLACAELVAAVSNAGGLGTLTALNYLTGKELKEDIKKTKSMTDKPFAVNVTLLPTIRPVNYEDYFTAAIEAGVNIIETSGRSPEPYIKLLKSARVKTLHRATRIRDIKTAERLGVDAVTILGMEAAGHPGEEDVTSLVRIPIAVDTMKIPVIAGGGISDARGFVAALALGAEGVLMGSRFMACQECNTHPKIKEWLLQLHETDTMLIQRSMKNTSRVVRTPYTEKIAEMEKRGAKLEELLPLLSGQRGRAAYDTGDFSQATISVGQTVGLIHDIPSAKEIIDRIIGEAQIIIQRLYKLGTGR
jgi:NAD(P)H-dependent flavin oxidoreductase YrpB (nitropropane dioxygenase family)